MNSLETNLSRLGKSFLFFLGLAAITQYGLSQEQTPLLDGPVYQAARDVSLLRIAVDDGVQLFPRP